MAKDKGRQDSGDDGDDDLDDDDADDGAGDKGKGGDGAGDKGKGGDGDVRDPKGVLRKNRELTQRVRELRAVARKFDGVDPDKARAAMERIEKLEEEEARAAGRFDELKGKMADKHKAEMTKAETKLAKMKDKLYRTLAQDNIIRVLADETDTPELLIPHIERHVQVVPVGDEDDPDDYEVVVLGKDNKPRVKNGTGDPFTIADLVTEMRDNPTYQPAFRAKVGSGTGHRAGNGNAAANARGGVVRISNADARDTAKYRAAKADAEKAGARLVITD